MVAMQSDTDGHDQAVTAANVDLTNCDRELIHAPDLIQPHGVMLVLRPSDLVILQASENTASLFGVAATDLAMKSLAEILGPAPAASLHAAIASAGDRLDSGPLQLLPQYSLLPVWKRSAPSPIAQAMC
jgi:chemotaxis family two-component system sensor kinase Cph1